MLTFKQFLFESEQYDSIKKAAKKLELSNFMKRYSVEGKNKKHIEPHHFFNISNIDPSEHDSWDNPDLSPHMKEKVERNRNDIRQGKSPPPILIKGRPDDPEWRPQVIDGHHRVIASYRERVKTIPGWFDDDTLKEIHKYTNQS